MSRSILLGSLWLLQPASLFTSFFLHFFYFIIIYLISLLLNTLKSGGIFSHILAKIFLGNRNIETKSSFIWWKKVMVETVQIPFKMSSKSRDLFSFLKYVNLMLFLVISCFAVILILDIYKYICLYVVQP